MGEAKISLRLDVSEALESIRKLRGEAKNVTSGTGRQGADDHAKWWKKSLDHRQHSLARLYRFELQQANAAYRARVNQLHGERRLQAQVDRDHAAALRW